MDFPFGLFPTTGVDSFYNFGNYCSASWFCNSYFSPKPVIPGAGGVSATFLVPMPDFSRM
jgi:hypothetical protein